MKMLVGLGNPGNEYENHRHNVGFMAADAIADYFSFPNWRSKFQGEFSKHTIGKQEVILLKPMTYMNLSGQSVGELARYHKIKPQNIYVFHDELDLKPGKVKYKLGGGAAGHNGLKSIKEHISADFHRIRIGIGHPGEKYLVNNWVLGNFSKQDQTDWLDLFLQKLPEATQQLVNKDAPAFLTKLALEKETIISKQETVPIPEKKSSKNSNKLSKQGEASGPFAALKDVLLTKSKEK